MKIIPGNGKTTHHLHLIQLRRFLPQVALLWKTMLQNLLFQLTATAMSNLQSHFSQVTDLIREARYEMLKTVNTGLISLYWNIGRYISDRVADNGWGKSIVAQLATFIAQNEPDIRGFSEKNLWRMKQFYEAYKNENDIMELVRQLSWTHNLLVFSKTKTPEERSFYLNLAIRERLNKRI